MQTPLRTARSARADHLIGRLVLLALVASILSIGLAPTAAAQPDPSTSAPAPASTEAPPSEAGPEAPSSEPPAPPSATAIELLDYDPMTVPIEELRIRLRPLRKAELEQQVSLLVDLVEQKSKEIAAADLAVRDATGAAQSQLADRSRLLKEERTSLIDRTMVAIDFLEERGGDVEENRRYLKAVSTSIMSDLSGITSGDSNAISAAWQATLSWFKSPEGGLLVARNVVFALVLLAIFWTLARIAVRLTRRAIARFPGTSALLRDFLAGLVGKLIMLVGLIVAISMLGVNIGPLAAAIGAAGLVIGLALQGTLSNFASGILILLYRPFDEGDFVTAGGISGKVESLTMVNTTVTTPDNQKVIVPNNSIWNDVITNVTGKPTRRVDLTFGIGYSDDVDKAASVLESVVKEHPLVLEDPAPVIRVNQLADSSVNFVVRPWARTEDYWAVYWDITRAVKQRFDAEKISIPFPQRDVHVYHVDDRENPREKAAG